MHDEAFVFSWGSGCRKLNNVQPSIISSIRGCEVNRSKAEAAPIFNHVGVFSSFVCAEDFLILCLLWIYEWPLQSGPWQDGCVYPNEVQFKEVNQQSKDFRSRGSWVLGQSVCFSEPGSCAGNWMQVLEAAYHDSVFRDYVFVQKSQSLEI